MDSEKNLTKQNESAQWFWKIFGGAMMSIIVVLLLTHMGSISSNADKSFLALKSEIKDLSVIVDRQKEKILNLEKDREKIENLEKAIVVLRTELSDLKQLVTVDNTSLSLLKDNIQILLNSDKDLMKYIQDIREKMAAAEASKKTAEALTNQAP